MDDRKLTAILISPRDNVATVTKDTLPGETVTYLRNGMTETIVSAGVPKYHKIALCEIPKGADIYKYGEIMGRAAQDIPAGTHVHCHNVTSGVKE
jgi:altronate dehydratase small subunit